MSAQLAGNKNDIELTYCACGCQLADACIAADVSGYPTWIVDGKRFEGEQTFETLAKASGFRMDVEYGPPGN